jgi:hypothetical protein
VNRESFSTKRQFHTRKGGELMKKLMQFALVAVLAASTIYATRLYAGNGSDAGSAMAASTTESAAKAVECPKNADCPAQCSGCPDYVDVNKDNRCDKRDACHTGRVRQGCPAKPGSGCHR